MSYWLCSDDMYETGVCPYCGHDTEEPYEYVKDTLHRCPNCGKTMINCAMCVEKGTCTLRKDLGLNWCVGYKPKRG